MAIRIDKNKHLIIDCGFGTCYEDSYYYIVSLLNLLQSITDDHMLQSEDVSYVARLIQHLLPDNDEFSQLQINPK